MRTLQEIEVLLQGKIVENKKGIQKYDKKIQEVEESKKQADADLLTAETEVDSEKYNKAKNAIWSAGHTRELYLKKQNKLKQERLVDKAEYTQLLSEITQVADAAHEEQNNRAAVFIAKLREISEESSQTLQKANSLMHLLQRELYKEPEGNIPSTNGTTTWSSDKKYNNQETVHVFYNSNIKGRKLAKRSGEKDELSTNRYFG